MGTGMLGCGGRAYRSAARDSMENGVSILEKIVQTKRAEIERARSERPLDAVLRACADAPPVRDFVGALRQAAGDPARGIGLIAEVKRASPSAGIIREDFDPVAIARTYERHGAACISCLTDEPFFQGRLEYLMAIRRAVSIPVLRKDFIIDRYQVAEARAAGADAVLLIAECLDDCTLRDLYFFADELGMEALIEVYEPANLDRVLALDPPLVGVNNRDLRTFRTDLQHTIRLADRVPEGTLLVSESGIRTADDVAALKRHGVRGILVGESLMRSDDIGAAVDRLLGRSADAPECHVPAAGGNSARATLPPAAECG